MPVLNGNVAGKGYLINIEKECEIDVEDAKILTRACIGGNLQIEKRQGQRSAYWAAHINAVVAVASGVLAIYAGICGNEEPIEFGHGF